MDPEALRALQAPLKQAYCDHPKAAHVVARAEAVLDQSALGCIVTTAQGLTRFAGLHQAAGGDRNAVCAGDMLLEALVACAGTTLAAVATANGVTLRAARITAEGDWDARGTLAADRAVPVGITAIRLHFHIDADIPEALRQRLIATTERYCVVLQTLRRTPPIVTTA